MTSRRRGGRIRVTDDSAATTGAAIVIRNEHSTAVQNTIREELSDETRKAHRRTLRKMIDWVMQEYPYYFEHGTRLLSEEEYNDPMNFYYKSNRDLVYDGLNVKIVLAYMGAHKTKANGRQYSFSHMRKIHDAILFGARTVKKNLPSDYYTEMESFLQSFKKETAKAKKEGNLDEKQADPISFTLYRLILSWSLSQGNLLLWTWTQLQWNLMARSISIDPLSLHNISIGEDCLVIRHDSTKSDKEGERLHKKHVYANPKDPMACPVLALGVWCCVNQDCLGTSETLFLRSGTKIGSAAQRYCEQLSHLFTTYADDVKVYVRRASTHGIRKGSATYVSSATTLPPPIASIANRGDWSLGKVLDVYWHFAEPGDAYLGRCLCGLDPNSADFAILPPHWKSDAPMQDPDISEAMNLMYGRILEKWRTKPECDPTGVLLRCLATVVHHQTFVERIGRSTPGHPFQAIPILQRRDLMNRLKQKLTVEPTDSMKSPTGIPPHVEQMLMMKNLLELCHATLSKVNKQHETIRQNVFDAFEQHAMENGQISRQQILDILQDFRLGIQEDVATQLQALKEGGFGQATTNKTDNQNSNAPGAETLRYQPFFYNGRFYDVPEKFVFPKGANRDIGFKLWMLGLPNHKQVENGQLVCRPIKPFRNLKPTLLPKQIANTFKLHWRPVFKLMEEGINVPGDTETLDAATINNLYESATEFLKTRVQYVFRNPRLHHRTWTISTWSKHVKRSHILQHGTQEDRVNLPEATRFNRSHSGRKRRVAQQLTTRTHRRQPRIVHEEDASAAS